jgi:hypothetical protein
LVAYSSALVFCLLSVALVWHGLTADSWLIPMLLYKLVIFIQLGVSIVATTAIILWFLRGGLHLHMAPAQQTHLWRLFSLALVGTLLVVLVHRGYAHLLCLYGGPAHAHECLLAPDLAP